MIKKNKQQGKKPSKNFKKNKALNLDLKSVASSANKSSKQKEYVLDIDCIANTKQRQALGLMFQKPKIMLFPQRKPLKIPIHMCFVFYPIWAVWLDKEQVVLDMKKAYPFALYISHKGAASYLLEVPCSLVANDNSPFSIGDTVKWKNAGEKGK
jgi:uncharacterized membrane protein (UPF0127 family)